MTGPITPRQLRYMAESAARREQRNAAMDSELARWTLAALLDDPTAADAATLAKESRYDQEAAAEAAEVARAWLRQAMLFND